MKPVYADHAASTPTDPRVVAAMLPFYGEIYANPSSLHSFGRKAATAIVESKQTIADFINASPDEVYLTGSGTESNNLAILGVARANKNKGKHIITTNIEHPSILNACRALEKDGYEVSYLPVSESGEINLEDLEKAITKETILVTTHYGNSEIGTLQDVSAIGNICRERGIYFHVDACQSAAYEAIDIEKMNIDLLTFNGSKMYGPKGAAVLFVKNGVNIFPIVYGGGQQKSLRSGTENVPGIVGLAKACQTAREERGSYCPKIKKLRDELQKNCRQMQGVSVNIDSDNRLPNHLSIRLDNRRNADLVKEMDKLSVAVSAGSACSSTSMAESHVLAGIGLKTQQAQSTLRITFGKNNNEKEVGLITSAIKKLAQVFRASL